MTFYFYLGGFLRDSYDLQLDGQQLICYEYKNVLFKDLEQPIIVNLKGNELWDNLIQHLSEGNWKRHYNAAILDGTQWSLKFVTQGVTVNAEGSNAYPPGFNKILSLLNDISGLDMQI